MLPVEAQTTALAPSCSATEIAAVMPRSLNEPVGLSPSTLSQTSPPVSPESHSECTSGVPPSRRVTAGVPSGSVEEVAVLLDHAAPLVGAGEVAPGELSGIHSSSPSTRITEVTSRTMSIARRCSTVAPSAASVAAWVTTTSSASCAAALLAHGRDRDAVLGERRGDRGQHAGAVVDVERDVVAGQGLPHRQHGAVGVRRLPGAAGPGEPVAGHRDQVAEHRAGGRRAAGAGAVEHQLAGGLGLDEDRVERVADRWPAGASAGSSPGARGRHRGLAAVGPASSQIASSLTTQPISRAAATSAAVTSVMPSRYTSAAVTRVWKASAARIAALAAASKPSTSAVGSASA